MPYWVTEVAIVTSGLGGVAVGDAAEVAGGVSGLAAICVVSRRSRRATKKVISPKRTEKIRREYVRFINHKIRFRRKSFQRE